MSFKIPDQTRAIHSSSQLTERELEVLTLVVQGQTSKEAADTLFLSKRTVDFHLTNIYTKLNVSNRVQALRVASKLGIIPLEPSFAHARISA